MEIQSGNSLNRNPDAPAPTGGSTGAAKMPGLPARQDSDSSSSDSDYEFESD